MKTQQLKKLLKNVFAPVPGEAALVMVDTPSDAGLDHPDWRERRAMAEEWREALQSLGVDTGDLLEFTATGSHNADLPAEGIRGGRAVDLAGELARARLVLAMTEYSASAPLFRAARAAAGRLRVASMPGVLRRMEDTALAADYDRVARRADILAGLLDEAATAEVLFPDGERMFFDLRHRQPHADRGLCRPGDPETLINLPGGEAYIVPYEGERTGDPSRSFGRIPVAEGEDHACLVVAENRIEQVEGEGRLAERYRRMFQTEPATRNVAEFGLGCNDRAVVSGSVLEDEKVGLHWAYGRSDHLGGVVKADDFSDPRLVVHQDLVYARGCPIVAAEVILYPAQGPGRVIQRDGEYMENLFE